MALSDWRSNAPPYWQHEQQRAYERRLKQLSLPRWKRHYDGLWSRLPSYPEQIMQGVWR